LVKPQPEANLVSRTIYLSRLIGLFTLIVVLSMLADKAQAIDTVRAVVADRTALLTLGMLGTAAGLAIVLGHQIWSGGVLPIIVTLIGWVILVRGTILLFLSQKAALRLVEWFHFEENFYLYLGFAALVGLYLAVHGFSPNAVKRRT
jgi:hypothetical protein